MEVADRAVVLRQGRYVGEETAVEGDAREARRDDRRRRRGGGRRARGGALMRRAAAGPARRAARGAVAVAAATRATRSAIGFVPKSLNQEYWVNTKKGAEAAQGDDVKVLTQGRRRRHPDRRADRPRREPARPGRRRARRSRRRTPTCSSRCSRRRRTRMPVVLFDSDIPDWKPKTAYVGTENEVGGEKAGRVHRQAAEERGRRSRSSPASPAPRSASSASTASRRGSRRAAAASKIVKEVTGQFDRNQAVGAMEDILQTEPRRRRRLRRQRPDGARRDPGDRRARQDRPDQADRLRRRARGDAAHPRRRHAGDDRPGSLRDGEDRRRGGAGQAATARRCKRTVDTGAKLITPGQRARLLRGGPREARRDRAAGSTADYMA